MNRDSIPNYYNGPNFASNSCFILRDKEFFDWVGLAGGLKLSSILECQSINSPNILLNTNDVFEIFNYDIPYLQQLKEESCFKLSNGGFIVKPGIKTGLIHVLKLLREAREEDHNGNPEQSNFEVLVKKKDSLISSLIKSCSSRKTMRQLHIILSLQQTS